MHAPAPDWSTSYKNTNCVTLHGIVKEGGAHSQKLWIWHRVRRPLIWKFATKVGTYSKIWSRITYFIYCCESHFCIFYHQIYVPDCQGGMEILDIPRFWKHLFSEVIFKPLNEKPLNKKITWLEGLVAKFCHLNLKVWWQNVRNLTHHFFRTAANTVQCPVPNITVYICFTEMSEVEDTKQSCWM